MVGGSDIFCGLWLNVDQFLIMESLELWGTLEYSTWLLHLKDSSNGVARADDSYVVIVVLDTAT